jgi:hypothetical protein
MTQTVESITSFDGNKEDYDLESPAIEIRVKKKVKRS